ncbi:hypothetical protein [Streptomyces sp. NPDC057616]|uniref:hypothetical protein n=1 Tax=Streptomyces sp. NPDC057616 TaxID=3346183 RepID=UPI0036D1FAD0
MKSSVLKALGWSVSAISSQRLTHLRIEAWSRPRRAVSHGPFCSTSTSAARRVESPRVMAGRAARINAASPARYFFRAVVLMSAKSSWAWARAHG